MTVTTGEVNLKLGSGERREGDEGLHQFPQCACCMHHASPGERSQHAACTAQARLEALMGRRYMVHGAPSGGGRAIYHGIEAWSTACASSSHGACAIS
jgi:hypothetical protein